MAGQVLSLRRVDGERDLRSARALAKEYGHWAAQVAKAEYGIDAETETEQGLSTSIDELLQPRARLYVAYVEGVAVGIGGLKPVSHEVAEIKRMYVRPSARGRGVGRALMKKLLDDVRELEFRIVRLESAAFMTASHELYRSVGFIEVSPSNGASSRRFPVRRAFRSSWSWIWTFHRLPHDVEQEARHRARACGCRSSV